MVTVGTPEPPTTPGCYLPGFFSCSVSIEISIPPKSEDLISSLHANVVSRGGTSGKQLDGMGHEGGGRMTHDI